MAVLINTEQWHVEFDANTLWVTSRETGLTLPIKGKGIAGQVRACLKTHSPDKTARVFSKILGPNAQWHRIYKRLPALA